MVFLTDDITSNVIQPVVVWSLGKYEKMDINQTETVTIEVAMCKAFECPRGAFYIEDEVITRAF